MNTYAQLINGVITGVHRNFSVQPKPNGTETWLPVQYGSRNTAFDKTTQKLQINRTLIDDGTKVLYEEIAIDLPLETVRANKLTKLKEDRQTKMAQGFTFNGKQFQTRDTVDITNLLGVGLGATMATVASQPFTTDFIATDNSVVSMDGPTTMMFIQTMLTEAQTLFNDYTAARDAVTAATTIEEIVAISL